MNIIVTGASKGIGFHTVLNLAQTGKHQLLAISRDKAGLALLESEFNKLKLSTLKTISLDLANKDYVDLKGQISTFFKTEKGGTVDILINNSGYLSNKLFLDLDDEDWQLTFEVNVFATARLIKTIYPFFNRTKGAHIVNIGSMGGVQGTEKFPGLSAYSASKGAINILTEALAKEFENENIKVNAINPGAVQTKMLEKAFPGFKAPVQANEMAEYIAHFATTAHKFMNGRLVEVSLKG